MKKKKHSSMIDEAPMSHKPSMRDDMDYAASSAARSMIEHHPMMEKTKRRVTDMLMKTAEEMHGMKEDKKKKK